MKMTRTRNNIPPDKKIKVKLAKYFFFTIIMSWSSIAISYFVSIFFQLKPENFYIYTPDISFMTIILASTNLKDLLESKISRDSLLFLIHIIINILNIVISLIYIAITTYIELSRSTVTTLMENQFTFIISMYFMAVFLGSCVQIGGVTRWD